MIKKDILLKEIPFHDYLQLLESIGEHRDESKYHPEGICFAQIIKTMSYQNLKRLLNDFRGTERARYVRVMVEGGYWKKYYSDLKNSHLWDKKDEILNGKTIDQVVEGAINAGFLCLAFSSYWRDEAKGERIPNNELSFEIINDRVMLRNMEIPSEDIREYGWETMPQADRYKKVRGVYVSKQEIKKPVELVHQH